MILGCHLQDDPNAHREAEIQGAWAALVDAAYAQGLDKAFKAAQSDDEAVDDAMIRRAFMVPWFIEGFVLNPPHSHQHPRYAEHVAKIDLAPVRVASERAKALVAEIAGERDVLRRRDVAAYDDLHMASVPPVGLSGSVVRHEDGRPRPVFHVTPNEGFENFLPISHFGSAITVSRHAYNLMRQAPFEHLDVHACWLDIRNPLVLEDEGSMASTWLFSKAQQSGAIDIEEMKWITGHPDPLGLGEDPRIEATSHPRRAMLDNLAVVLLDKGYDGIRYDNAIEGGGASWVNLRSDQVIVDRVMRFGVGDGCFEPMEPSVTSAP